MFKKAIIPVSLIVLSLAGLLFSYTLAEEITYMDLPRFEGSTSPAIFSEISAQVCGDPGTYFSCGTVSKSKYARVYGFPVALFGVWFYLMTLLFCLAYLFGPRAMRPVAAVILFWTTTVGVIIDIGLFIISFVTIDALCPLCLATYLINILLMVLAIVLLVKTRTNPIRLIRLSKALEMSAKRRAIAICMAMAILCVILVVSAGAAFGLNLWLNKQKIDYIIENKDKEILAIVAAFAKQAREDIHPDAMHVYGDKDAPVTIVEFSDFLCPYCAYISTVMDELIEKNPHKISVFFVNYPLDITCNSFMRRPMHQGSCELAKGAICAAAQDSLYQYQKITFAARNNHPTIDDMRAHAFQAGMDLTQFEQCRVDLSTAEILKSQIAQSQSYGINATPTIYINNKRYHGRLYIEALQKIIDMEAKRSQNH